jgi:uncharacterized protein
VTGTFFWDIVTKHRSYVIGGNSKNEHCGLENTEELGIQTNETCNTYNMLKLTEHLFKWTHKAEYMDYYERALYNHILASQDPDTGMKTYFVSTQPGHFIVNCSLMIRSGAVRVPEWKIQLDIHNKFTILKMMSYT